MHLCIWRNDAEDDLERHVEADDKYVYVHPSIRKVLVMEPCGIHLDVLESEDVYGKNVDGIILVNSDDFTIRWTLLEKFLDNENSKIESLGSQNTILMEQLVTLASQCDKALFKDYNKHDLLKVPSPIRGLLRILPEQSCVDPQHQSGETSDAHVLVATLLALNMVENSIRHLIGKKNGKAPLLKDMIEIMAARGGESVLPKSVVSVLRTLLLPTNGLNLRNLVWHGFLPSVPRRWLSLSIVLVLSLDELTGSSSFEAVSFNRNSKAITGMRKHEALVALLNHGKGILGSPEKLNSLKDRMIKSNIIPRSHIKLFEVSLEFAHYPIVFASVVGPLIEHLLRLMWCRENKQNKRVATPGAYYVTLDGHGQKDKHEIVVMPFFSHQGDSKGVRNKLVGRLGGSTMAFLMDMFTSPIGGPNIRAIVAHGSLNKDLFKELVAIGGERGNIGIDTDEFMDLSSALLSVLSVLDGQYSTSATDVSGVANEGTILGSYRPCFSYTASLLTELGNMVNSIESYYDLIGSGHHLKYAMNVSQSQKQIEIAQTIASMSPGFEAIVDMKEKIYQQFGAIDSEFTDQNFFQESTNNLIASECGAAKLLLSEIEEAASSSLQDLDHGISALQSDEVELSSRRRKQVARICATAELTLDFYSFSAYCALLYIERRQDTSNRSEYMKDRRDIDTSPTNQELFVAVKRSRMVVSTFSTTKTFDRALSALAQYIAGKAIKSINESICNSSIH